MRTRIESRSCVLLTAILFALPLTAGAAGQGAARPKARWTRWRTRPAETTQEVKGAARRQLAAL